MVPSRQPTGFLGKAIPGRVLVARKSFKGCSYFLLGVFGDIPDMSFFLMLISFLFRIFSNGNTPMAQPVSKSWYDTGAVSASLPCQRLARPGMCETCYVTRKYYQAW